MKNKNPDFYINISLVVFVTILTSAFFKDFVFEDNNTLVEGAISGLVGVIAAGGLFLLLKNQSNYIKVSVGVSFIIALVIISRLYNKTDITGNWITKENSTTCKLSITEKEVIMSFSTENSNHTYEYELEDKLLTLYNDEESEMIEWRILKVTQDSLIIQDVDDVSDTHHPVYRFAKE